MTLRIVLSEETGESRPLLKPAAVRRPGGGAWRDLPVVDLDGEATPPMLLFLPDEPEIGRRFSYGGADWEVVDYQDGWIARLLVAY